ncbi:hypothetical protein EJ08DRAFT_599360 [Tothia fuscella]|uniref:DUF7492 domain-containing protein n=1 Tax=Tothia fuscella TaxID=1048955 RepID=A0A9P4NFE6_9PEZI|nr:hypothetical protein EJ08DRAFT_599360 [Tothia fuscella]
MRSLFALAALFIAQSSGHTWLEQIQAIDESGKYAGVPGYPRGFVDRMSKNPPFSDTLMTYLLPPNGEGRSKLDGSEPLCQKSQQQAGTNSQEFPALRATPGTYVAMKYLENGHVTAATGGKPGSGGLVYMYATTQPKPDTKLVDALKWQPDGDLAQGRLLAINNYDDMRCYQINDANAISLSRQQSNPDPIPDQPGSKHEQWCETNFQIPKEATGDLAVYWVWQWPTLPGKDSGLPVGKDEIYTTCSDIKIVTDANSVKAVEGAKQVAGQDPQVSAVPDFKERAANVTIPADTAYYGPNNSGNFTQSPSSPAQPPASPVQPPASPKESPAQPPASPSQLPSSPAQPPAPSQPPFPRSSAGVFAPRPSGGFTIQTKATTLIVTRTATATRMIRGRPTGAKFR